MAVVERQVALIEDLTAISSEDDFGERNFWILEDADAVIKIGCGIVVLVYLEMVVCKLERYDAVKGQNIECSAVKVFHLGIPTAFEEFDTVWIHHFGGNRTPRSFGTTRTQKTVATHATKNFISSAINASINYTFRVLVMLLLIIQDSILARVSIAVHTKMPTCVIHTDILTNHTTADKTLTLIL